jgi:hypothetical protein
MTEPSRSSINIMLSTTDYEFSHGRSPGGRGSWAFEFDAQYFDIERLEQAMKARDATDITGRHGRIDTTTYPRRVLIWMPVMLYSDAKRAAVILAKLGARVGVSTIVGKVAT